MSEVFRLGDPVTIPWGAGRVRGKVHEVYEYGDHKRVVVELTPETSGYVVDEPTTVVFPPDSLEHVAA